MRTIIIKVTHSCNLGCKYCCVGDVPDHRPMSFDTIRSMFSKLAEEGSSSSLIWHGGEPLCVGLDFYRKVVELQKEFPTHHFKNGIQTNGTLLSDEFLIFCKDYKFQLGFSIDGCRDSHNLNRPYKSGKYSFDDTFKWFLRAKELGLHVGAICVINANTAKYIDEIYQFSREYKVPFKFNPQYPAGRASVNVDLGLDNDQIADAYIRLFDLWYHDTPELRANIQMFDKFVDAIGRCTNGDESLKGYDCAYCNRCQYSYVGIAPNGDVYPCGKFVGEESCCCGNVNQGDFSFKGLLEHPVVKSIIKRHEKGVPECKDCEFLSLCSSGCPYNAKLFSGDFLAKNPFCRANLLLFDHIKKTMMDNNVAKDIYVIPSGKSDNQSIIYSPLRGKAFMADAVATNNIRQYLKNFDLKSFGEPLRLYLEEWEKQIAVPAKKMSNHNDRIITILLTNACNLACSYCYAKRTESHESLTKEQLKAVIDYVLNDRGSYGLRHFSFIGGGEPTLEWEKLKWSIEYIRAHDVSHEFKISITTNCSLLNQERILWMKEKDISIAASFDILPDIQNSQRTLSSKRASYDVVDSNILCILEYKINVRIRATITKRFVCRMPEMVRFVHEKYPDIHHLQFEPVMDAAQNDEEFFNDFVAYFIESVRLGKSLGIEVFNMLSLSVRKVALSFCKGELCICPSGEISLCHRVSSKNDPSWKNFHFGNVDEKGVHLDKVKFNRIMSYHSEKGEDCATCFAQYHCAGGCMAFRSILSNERFKLYCNYSQKMIREILLYNIYNS